MIAITITFFATPAATQVVPSWEERVIHQLTNRARVDPASELAGCTGCSSAELSGCYSAMVPVSESPQLFEAARFHSAFMMNTSTFAHSNNCVLHNDIAARYPELCDGTFACSCSGAGTTAFGQRLALFLGSYPSIGAENIAAGYATPHSAFYGWLWEPSPTATCSNYYKDQSDYNGHRWNILKTTAPAMGAGYQTSGSGYPYWTQDFGPGTSASTVRLVSGAHWSSSDYSRQGTTTEFWANWYSASAPTVASVVINGTAHAMTLARGTSTNGAWTVSRSGLSSGCHRYYFSFVAGGTTYRYPTSGTLGIGNPATCADWQGAGSFVRGDFNQDGKVDLLWRNFATGAVNVWYLNGTTYTSGANLYTVADQNWKIEAVGDFNGDGKSDLVWRNYGTGDVNVWFLDGATYIGGANLSSVPDANWRIETAGDFNGDGKDDLIWRNYSTGAVNAWFLNGTTYVSGANLYTIPDLNWEIEGSGDFNGDGHRDLLWRNYSTGAVNAWFLNGTTYVSGANLYSVPDLNWRIEAVGDYNGDTKVDIIWRNYSTGAVNAWFLNGTTYVSGSNLYSIPDANWKIAGPR